jgi:hypothetical protein
MASLPEDPGSWVTRPILATPRHGYRGLGRVLSWVIRGNLDRPGRLQNPLHSQPLRGDKKGLVRTVPRFSSFKLVVPPLQSGALGLYPVRGAWFPSRLPLEGTRSYPYLLDHNWWPTVPGVQDPDNRPRDFHRVGAQGRLLDERLNRYSYVTMGAVA